MGRTRRSASLYWIMILVFMGIFWATNIFAQNTLESVISEELLLKAQVEGTVRVIVHIREPFKPEGEMKTSDAVASQRRGITHAQDRLFKELDNIRYRVIRRFATIPFVAIEAGIHALAILGTSGLVVSVEEDRISERM